MKKKFIISLTIFAISFAFIIFTIFNNFHNLKSSQTIIYISLAILILSFIYGQILLYPKKIEEHKLISSRLTSINKFYIPILFIACFFINTSWIILELIPSEIISLAYALDILFIFWLVTLGIMQMKLKLIYINKKNIIVSNYFDINEYSINEVSEVNYRFSTNTCKITINKETGTKKVIILPKLEECARPFITPKSIKILKNYIEEID